MRINDTALVEAAIMSDRYIADRFLPDKAIDLIDEAAAKLKMEITSKPLHLDEIDRKVPHDTDAKLARLMSWLHLCLLCSCACLPSGKWLLACGRLCFFFPFGRVGLVC